MNIQIQSLHFDADKKLIQFVEERVEKLSSFYDKIVGTEVILKLDKSDSSENKVVEIKALVPGSDLFAKKHAKTFEEAVDKTVDAIRQQIVKKKEKVKSH